MNEGAEIKCLYINARSIMNKLNEFGVTVEELGPDVIGVTESWVTDQVLDSELAIGGYVLFRADRQGGDAARGGGVLLYVKESLQPVEFKPKTGVPEQIWCRLLSKRGQELLIGVCYRTPSMGFF